MLLVSNLTAGLTISNRYNQKSVQSFIEVALLYDMCERIGLTYVSLSSFWKQMIKKGDKKE